MDGYEVMLQSAPESPDGMQFHHTSHEELVHNFQSGADTIYVPANGTVSGVKRTYDNVSDANGSHMVANTIQVNAEDCDAYETSIKRKYAGAIQPHHQ